MSNKEWARLTMREWKKRVENINKGREK